MSKNEEIIAYIVNNRVWCSITEIMNICYLIDLGFVKEFKNKVTNFNYVVSSYGPFSNEIFDLVNGLVNKWVFTYKCTSLSSGDVVCKYEIEWNNGQHLPLSTWETDFFNGMLWSLSQFNAYQLTQISSKTKPLWGDKKEHQEEMGKKIELVVH